VFQKNKCSSKDGVKAVRPLSLSAQSSSVLIMLGPNSAGKTTTIRCLTGLCNPTDGTARVFGHDINSDMDTIQNMIGICPQFDVYVCLCVAVRLYSLPSF
jgi:ABC-type multidrug transport system ATPase subunit